MATAIIRESTVLIQDPPVLPPIREIKVPEGVDLHLSQTEAAALQAVLRHVAGSPLQSPRGLTDRIKDALNEAGFDIESNSLVARYSELSNGDTLHYYNGIYFRHYED